jgi:hypothetical protein
MNNNASPILSPKKQNYFFFDISITQILKLDKDIMSKEN